MMLILGVFLAGNKPRLDGDDLEACKSFFMVCFVGVFMVGN